jgi:hypothetical protein
MELLNFSRVQTRSALNKTLGRDIDDERRYQKTDYEKMYAKIMLQGKLFIERGKIR